MGLAFFDLLELDLHRLPGPLLAILFPLAVRGGRDSLALRGLGFLSGIRGTAENLDGLLSGFLKPLLLLGWHSRGLCFKLLFQA